MRKKRMFLGRKLLVLHRERRHPACLDNRSRLEACSPSGRPDKLTDSYSLCRMRSTTQLTDVALTQSQVQMALF